MLSTHATNHIGGETERGNVVGGEKDGRRQAGSDEDITCAG